ncbi:MAG TPA: hypothetical protein VEI52_10810 [Terriglobales bacterium]|nr:hypothetical protein [Terriglobales bacterium]
MVTGHDGIYELPFFQGHRWISGWSTAEILFFQTGLLFSLRGSSADGEFGDCLTYIGSGSVTP